MGTTTTFAAALAATTVRRGHCCRVGELVDKLDPASKGDAIAALADPSVSTAVFARAIGAALASHGINETVVASTVGAHRNNGHEIV